MDSLFLSKWFYNSYGTFLKGKDWFSICFVCVTPHFHTVAYVWKYNGAVQLYNDAWFRKSLTSYNTAIDFDILVLMQSICGFQHNLLSIIIPRNLISNTNDNIVYHAFPIWVYW